MIILKLNRKILHRSEAEALGSGWVISEDGYDGNKWNYIISSDGHFWKARQSLQGWENYQQKCDKVVYRDKNNRLTYDINLKDKYENKEEIPYKYEIVCNTIVSEHLGFKTGEVGVCFKNLQTQEFKSILVDPQIVNSKICSDSGSVRLKVMFSKDCQTVLIYQSNNGNGKVLIMDNPVFD